MDAFLATLHNDWRKTLESHYTQQLNETTLTMGKSTRRKHTHMRMQPQPGINAEC